MSKVCGRTVSESVVGHVVEGRVQEDEHDDSPGRALATVNGIASRGDRPANEDQSQGDGAGL